MPVTYLEAFTDTVDRIWAYRKDEPTKPLHMKPSEIGFERYYYSQPRPDGGRDDAGLEQIFGTMEARWPSIVSGLKRQEALRAEAGGLVGFMALMRARGPAARDGVELMLAQQAKVTAKMLDATGKLPPPPAGFEDILDLVEVSVDPHMSLHAMPHLMSGVGKLFEQLGYVALHNETEEPFITSDNPVIYFDPRAHENTMLPYTVRPPGEPVELLFPITPRIMLQGRSDLREASATSGVLHQSISNRQWVKRANRLVARFGYSLLFANHAGIGRLVAKHAAVSPVARFDHVPGPDGGQYLLTQMIFGSRPKKAKWDRKGHSERK